MENLQEARIVLQKIIDKHLPEGERFSIQEINEEQIWFLIEVFLEKDEIERDRIWANLEAEIEESRQNIQESMTEIQKIKELLDAEKVNKTDLTDLMNLINTDSNFEKRLNDFDI